MRWRNLHLVVGLVGVVVFLGTGAYMRATFPDLYAANEALRYTARANHVYVLLASLVNIVLGLYLPPLRAGWRAAAATVGSILALASPAVLCFAFVFEAPMAAPERVLTLVGVVTAAAGVALHLLGGARRRDDSNLGVRQ
jgi:hypothetical protein